MTINKDHRGLRQQRQPEPTTTRPPALGSAIAVALVAHEQARGPLPMASDTAKVRHSWAGGCARRIAYEIEGVTPPEPADANPSSAWAFRLGRITHEIVQAALIEQFGRHGATVLDEVKLAPNATRAGTADLIIEFPEPTPCGLAEPVTRLLCEFKSMGGFKFGKQVEEEGPAVSAYLQAAMNAVAADCDAMVIGAMALDQFSPARAKKVYGPDWRPEERFWAEWWYSRSEFEADGIAEGLRMERIAKMVSEGKKVPRHVPVEMPDMARVIDPRTGRWEQRTPDGQIRAAGFLWLCGYCPFQTHCANDR